MKETAVLKWSGAVLGATGLAFSLALAVDGVLESLYRLVGSVAAGPLGPEARLGVAIYGGLMVGWGVMIYLLGRGASAPRAAAVGIVAWWVVDSAGSIAVGFPLNVLLNTAFLAGAMPLARAGFRRRAGEATRS